MMLAKDYILKNLINKFSKEIEDTLWKCCIDDDKLLKTFLIIHISILIICLITKIYWFTIISFIMLSFLIIHKISMKFLLKKFILFKIKKLKAGQLVIVDPYNNLIKRIHLYDVDNKHKYILVDRNEIMLSITDPIIEDKINLINLIESELYFNEWVGKRKIKVIYNKKIWFCDPYQLSIVAN